MTQRLIGIVYNIALGLVLLLGSPWWIFLVLTRSKFRDGFAERFFGMSRSAAEKMPPAPRIWIHAVSVGEVLAISRLVQELAKSTGGHNVVISTTTRTGQQMARARFGASACFYFPFDFPWSVATTLRRIAPSMLILAESELWPNVLTACHRKNVPVVIVNARISDRSLPRYQRLKPLWQPFLRSLSRVFAQTEQDAARLQQIGIPADRIAIGGNLKFDIRAPQDVVIRQMLQQHLLPNAKLFVCGSTLEGEEALLLQAWQEIVARVPNAVMLLAPRHPERFDTVADELAGSRCAWVRRSEWISKPTAILAGSVFLLDSIGELASLYALARLAFVGGSLVSAGGHNPLEPAQFGVAIAVGPYMQNFAAIAKLLLENNAMVTVQPAQLATTITRLFLDDTAAAVLGENAKQTCDQHAGASARCASAIVSLLGEQERV